MKQIFIGVIFALLLVIYYLYTDNKRLNNQIIESKIIAKNFQADLNRATELNTQKQKELENKIKAQQKLRSQQNITLQDKKCISQEFLDKINENF